MGNIPIQILEQIKQVICRPVGTVSFRYTFKDMFNADIPGGVVFEVPSGEHVFRIERDNDLLLQFYHSSPGTGTRVACVDLNKMTPADSLFLAFSWTPEEINFHVGPQIKDGQLISAKGTTSKKQFRVGKDGSIYQVGDEGIEVMAARIYQGGKAVLEPTAINLWDETVRAIEILGTGESKEGYIYESVLSNMSLSMLVTGFETYAKKRFQELEQEGIKPNTHNLIKGFFPKKERDAGIEALLISEAGELKLTPLQLILERDVINFQNFRKCKLAYNKAYNIKFGEIGIESNHLDYLKKLFKYRHRIIHVSPILGMLNGPEVPLEEPVFSNKTLTKSAHTHFDQFVRRLHEASLGLKRDD